VNFLVEATENKNSIKETNQKNPLDFATDLFMGSKE
jgi:hypothetical protein